MNEASFILDTSLLEPLEGSTLFYPCSGNDLITPITLFSPYISNFWFVDRGYFTPGHQDTRFDGLDAPADEQPPLLADNPLYRLLDTRIKGKVSQRRKVDIDPCILTEHYEHLATGKTICIHKRRGYGFSAFRNEDLGDLGVFFYRGDSSGEGGSGNHWLKADHMGEILAKLLPGGLIVSDGSDGACYYSKGAAYGPVLRQYRDSKKNIQAIMDEKPAFKDKLGHQFKCVGYAGHRYGPTLIWQVT